MINIVETADKAYLSQNHAAAHTLATPPPPRIAFFDGLRGWAAFVVLFSHINAAVNGLHFSPIPHLEIPVILNAAGFAVQIFFVLSGVVLSFGFMRNKDFDDLGGLAVKRIPRLAVPCLFSSIIIYILLKNNLMYNQAAAAAQQGGNIWLSEYYTFEPAFQDVLEALPKSFITGVNCYNAVLWTMRWELLGSYFLIIFIIVLYPLKQKKMFYFWLFVTALLLFFATAVAAFSFGLLISHIFVDRNDKLAALRQGGFVKIITAAAILVLCVLVSVFIKFGFERISGALKIITAALAVGSLTFIKTLQRFFSNRVSGFLGKIAFPLYITHFPLVFSLTSYLMVRFPDYGNSIALTILIYGLSIAASLAAACLFYPVEKFSLWFSKRLYKLIRI
jgi:peptidoglycan/LPS O-acetylase OafA/YrhL